MMGKVWFVGAGPGDPELITVKGRHLLARAGAVLFAGSLVDQAATLYAPDGCTIRDSKDMTLEQITAWLIEQAACHETVVRLQTGDPGLYGALIEMVRPLDAAGIKWAVVPGVSSAMAAAAAAGETLTLPEVTQTVIFTRVAGRTPMPPGEDLEALAAHRTTLCIFLSITLLHEVPACLARRRLAGRRAAAGRAKSQLARAGENRARHTGRHQAPLPGRKNRHTGHDHCQPHTRRTALAGHRPLQTLRPGFRPPLSPGIDH